MEQAGPIVRKLVSRKKQQLLETAAEIRTEPPSVVYLASQLVQCTLPHSDPGDLEWWSRTNGNLTLSIRSGGDAVRGRYGIPYGTLPRLLLIWINTEAKRTGSPQIQLGANLSEFMEALELHRTGGSRGDVARLKEQMRRLVRSTISFTYKRTGRDKWLDMLVAESGTDQSFEWWDLEQNTLWNESITLGNRFFQCLTASPVPTNMRAIRAIRNSSLLLDLYSWSTHRVFMAKKTGEAVTVDWYELQSQLGADYSSIKEFARNIRNAFKTIRQVYPGLEIEFQPGSLTILPRSELAVSDGF